MSRIELSRKNLSPHQVIDEIYLNRIWHTKVVHGQPQLTLPKFNQPSEQILLQINVVGIAKLLVIIIQIVDVLEINSATGADRGITPRVPAQSVSHLVRETNAEVCFSEPQNKLQANLGGSEEGLYRLARYYQERIHEE